MRSRTVLHCVVGLLALMACSCTFCGTDKSMDTLMALASPNDKPFVVVGDDGAGKGQGVVITGSGYVLTAAHVTYDEEADVSKEEITVSFRKDKPDPWPGMFHEHTDIVVDAAHVSFVEEDYKARVVPVGPPALLDGKERAPVCIDGKDLALLKIGTTAELPHVDFYSKEEPDIRLGERLYLCHYMFPDEKADPIFIISPIKVIGVAKNTSGIEYLAQGFFRWGSSGGAILKDGKLIGIQCNGYTVNSPAGEVSLGHISFQVVYEKLIDGMIEPGASRSQAKAPAAPPESTGQSKKQ